MAISPLLHCTYQSKSGGTTIRPGHFCRAANRLSPVRTPYRLAGWLLASTTPWRFSSSPPTAAGTVRRSSVPPPFSALSADQDKNAEFTSTWNQTVMAGASFYHSFSTRTPSRAAL